MQYIKEYSDFLEEFRNRINGFYTIPDEIINNVEDVLDDMELEYSLRVFDHKHFVINILFNGSSVNKEFTKPFLEFKKKLRNKGIFHPKEIIKKILGKPKGNLSSKAQDDADKRTFGHMNSTISRICKLSGFSFTSFECPSEDGPLSSLNLYFFNR